MSVLAQLTLRLVTKCLTPDQALAANEKLLKSLVTHSQERTPDDYLNRTIMSAFLLRILQKGGFFGRRTTEGVDPVGKELAIGVQMLELLQALQFNAHEVYETVAGEDHPINGSKMNYIGGDRVGFLDLEDLHSTNILYSYRRWNIQIGCSLQSRMFSCSGQIL